MHRVTTARIQVPSSPAVPEASPGLPAGGWKATFLPSCSGSCLANASRLAFGSRENGIAGIGPTELRNGIVMETPLLPAEGVVAERPEPAGDGARGRLFRLSVKFPVSCGCFTCVFIHQKASHLQSAAQLIRQDSR